MAGSFLMPRITPSIHEHQMDQTPCVVGKKDAPLRKGDFTNASPSGGSEPLLGQCEGPREGQDWRASRCRRLRYH